MTPMRKLLTGRARITAAVDAALAGRHQGPVRQIPEELELDGYLVKEGIRNPEVRNHGNGWSIYVSDPEGSPTELYTASPFYVSRPFREPLDRTPSRRSRCGQSLHDNAAG